MLWSKLQKQLYNIIDPTVNFQMHCSIYKTRTYWCNLKGKGREMIPRFWITIDKETIWDFPNMFLDELTLANTDGLYLVNEKRERIKEGKDFTIKDTYFYEDNYKWVSNVIRGYIDTPKSELLTVEFEKDKFGLVNILRKYDRRISKNKRKEM